MKKKTLWGMLLLVAVVLITAEAFVIARWKTGLFDLRCAYLQGYVIAHTHLDGKEATLCVHNTP